MTAKGREKVQQQGLWDNEVSMPKHDEICMWAHENALQIAREIFPEQFDRAWQQADILSFPRDTILSPIWNRDSQQQVQRPRPNPKVKVHWEMPLYETDGRYQRPLGFADLVIEVQTPWIAPKWRTVHGKDDEYDGCVVSFDRNYVPPMILIEAKSKLPTMGELMRQLNHYRKGFRGPCVVLSPDDRLATLLSDQDIRFIRFPG